MSIEEALREALVVTMRECLGTLLREELVAALPEALRSVGAAPGAPSQGDRLLSVAEAAALLGIAKPTVRDWIKRGYVRAVPLGPEGRRYAIRMSDLTAALERGTAGGRMPTHIDVDEEAAKIVRTARGRGSRVR